MDSMEGMAFSDDESETFPDNVSDYEFISDDRVCAICDDGGYLVYCDGKCKRAFHATVADGWDSNCESLGLTAAELLAHETNEFFCENCKYKRHQCFACGELGSSDESLSPQVFCCVIGDCGRFYHPVCAALLLHPGNSAAAGQLQQRIAAGEQFTCPSHSCHACNGPENRSIRERQFAVCRRCPRAYHRSCLPREIVFEDGADVERGIYQRAWEHLLPDRILIFCMDHAMDPSILNHAVDPTMLTPVRDHIRFPVSEITGGVGAL